MEYATRLVVVVELIQIVLCIIILTNLARNDSIEFTDDESTISAASGGELQSVSNRRNFRTHVIGVLLVIMHLKRMEHAQLLRSKKDHESETGMVPPTRWGYCLSWRISSWAAVDLCEMVHSAVCTIDSTQSCVKATCAVQALWPCWDEGVLFSAGVCYLGRCLAEKKIHDEYRLFGGTCAHSGIGTNTKKSVNSQISQDWDGENQIVNLHTTKR